MRRRGGPAGRGQGYGGGGGGSGRGSGPLCRRRRLCGGVRGAVTQNFPLWRRRRRRAVSAVPAPADGTGVAGPARRRGVCVSVCGGVDGCPGRRTLPPPFVRCRRERGGKMATPRLLHRISNSTPLALCVPPRLAGLPAAGQGWMGCSPRPGLPTSPGGLLLPPGCKQGLEVTGEAAADGPGVARVGSGRGPSGVAAFPKPAAVKKALERLAEVVQACRERNLRRSGVANSRQAAALEKSEVVFYKAWPSNVFNYAFRKHRLKWKKRGSPA